jgi:Tol biopolymer transport system component
VVLLLGGGAYYLVVTDSELAARFLLTDPEPLPPATEVFLTAEPPTTEATTPATSEPTVEPTVEVEVSVGDSPIPEGTGEPETTDTPPVSDEPQITSLIFAQEVTEDYEPVNATTSFEEGITEIHALFDYSGILEDYTWERVWYLDGEEILRNAATWTDEEAGRFDYYLDAGGEPLPPGEWELEIYVEDELLASGAFTIEGEEVAAAAEQPTPEPEATVEETATVGTESTVEATATLTPTVTPSPTSEPAASGGGTYQLVFSKWDGGQHNLYVADTNGNNEQFILNRAAGPSWTPDGSTIFFYGEEGIDRQKTDDGREFVFDGISNGIVAMPASPLPTSIDQVQLTQGLDWKQGTARWANVSPNGQMVAFDAKFSGNYRIYFLGTTDNLQYRYEILGEQADWSPDSQKLVYRSGRNGSVGIWISNRDDTGHVQISNGGSDSFPAWSPDGRTIAFSRDEGGNVDIFTMNTDGTNVQRLTTAPGPDTLPTFTPSGDIVFRSARSGSWGVWKMGLTGANQQEIIADAGVGPDWAYSKMDVR